MNTQETTLEIHFDTQKEFTQKEVVAAATELLQKLDPKAKNIDIDFNQDEVEVDDEDSEDATD